ncbi:MAG: VWA domain-containing protein [Acidimicrobiia bacterium]
MAQHTNEELLARIEQLEHLLSQPGIDVPQQEFSHVDMWFLLDRSGSMQSIATDVVGGFDAFFAEQRQQPGTATVTFVQFDDHDPHERVFTAKPIDKVGSVAGRFHPRGSTPLFDAIGLLLDRAERHVARGNHPADQLVVIFTDGMENASRHWTAQQINARIADLRAAGWTFVFLGANQDSYATTRDLAMAGGSTSNFEATSAGVAMAYDRLSANVSAYRSKPRMRRVADESRFWDEAGKPED